MDVKWIVDEQMAMVANGGCEYLAVAGILNALAMSETDVMSQYLYASQAIEKLLKDDEKKSQVICKMILEVIQDEGNHDASFKKAAAIISGYKEPKPDEYNKAVKSNDVSTV